jgi:histidinol dehydrogenase
MMKMQRGPAADVSEHRRDREAGRLVYPVVSRRSGGLSVGVNLFPDAKKCNFDCPYCEVFPFPEAEPFSVSEFESELSSFLATGWAAAWAPEIIRDICISGNGEPSLSPFFEEAAALCAGARERRPELLGQAKLVVITNSTGFMSAAGRAALGRVQDMGFEIWAKLDGGTEAVFERMSRSRYGLDAILKGIRTYAVERSIVLQTMLCEVEGVSPSDEEMEAYATVVASLLEGGARIGSIQLYTLARPASGGACLALSEARILRLSENLRRAIEGSGFALPIAVFGSRGALAAPSEPAPSEPAPSEPAPSERQ